MKILERIIRAVIIESQDGINPNSPPGRKAQERADYVYKRLTGKIRKPIKI